MPLTVVLVCGPRQAGKSALIECIGDELADHPPHHIRLVVEDNEASHSPGLSAMRRPNHTASSTLVTCGPDTVTDVLTDALRGVRRRERYATVLIEGDCARSLRNALPYDHHVFVMPAPRSVHEVFRRPHEATAALREVMQDTEAFAAEMFGLFIDESELLSPDRFTPDQLKQRASRVMNSAQVARFLRTPLGAEIASRIQLQPAYQGMTGSDVVVVNTAAGVRSRETDECVQRIETLLSRICRNGNGRDMLYRCDPADPLDPARPKLLARLVDLCVDPL